MKRIRYIHWNPEEAIERGNRLKQIGYDVDAGPYSPAALRLLRQGPPDAVVIDLSRLPSQGRDIALQIRQFKPLRYVPIIFLEGDPEKIERIRKLLPDASYSDWDQISNTLLNAISNPPENFIVPGDNFAAYAGTPLVKKLGIKAFMTVTVIGAPPGFVETLAGLPDGVRFREQFEPTPDLILWFLKSRAELVGQIEQVRANTGKGGVWMIWPKKNSGISSDLTQAVVRQAGLAAGLVDYKVSAIDKTWTGLRFAVRKIQSTAGRPPEE
ncbi:MAG: two-component system response regulator [Omnitrophica WOR_2 bacterium]